MNKQDEIPFIKPIFDVSDKVLSEIENILKSGHVTNNGPYVQQFESELARYLDVQQEQVTVVTNGSSALWMALKALKSNNIRGLRALMPAYTYIATANAAIHAGFIPAFVDIEPESWTLDPESLVRALETYNDVGVVIPVNVFGVNPDLDSILEVCQEYEVPVVYDNAHGFGSKYKNKHIQDSIFATIYSFHATKLLPAVEGGAIVSSIEVSNLLKQLRNHGLSKTDLMESIPGFNTKMDEIRALIGLNNLENIDNFVHNRRHYASILRKVVEATPDIVRNQKIGDYNDTNFQNLGIRFVKKGVSLNKIIDQFYSYGVNVRHYFWPPLNRIKSLSGDQKTDVPVTDEIANSVVCLPMYSIMNKYEIDAVVQALVRIISWLNSL